MSRGEPASFARRAPSWERLGTSRGCQSIRCRGGLVVIEHEPPSRRQARAMKEYLLTAGPTPVPERVLQAMARPMLYHRSPPFTECLREVQDGLRWLLQSKQLPLLMSGSGTVGMDAAVCNFLRAGDKAVVIRGGKFGERWGKICQAY